MFSPTDPIEGVNPRPHSWILFWILSWILCRMLDNVARSKLWTGRNLKRLSFVHEIRPFLWLFHFRSIDDKTPSLHHLLWSSTGLCLPSFLMAQSSGHTFSTTFSDSVIAFRPRFAERRLAWSKSNHREACWWHNFDHDHASRG